MAFGRRRNPEPPRDPEPEQLSPEQVVERYRHDPLFRGLADHVEVHPHRQFNPEAALVTTLEAYWARLVAANYYVETRASGKPPRNPTEAATETFISEVAAAAGSSGQDADTQVRAELQRRNKEVFNAHADAMARFEEFESRSRKSRKTP